MVNSLLLATVLAIVSVGQVGTGEDVVRAMYDRYTGKWYENLALVQTVTYWDIESGTLDSVRVWYESIKLPGTVRSDIAPVDAGNRQVYKDETWSTIEADTLVSSFPGPHPILLLGFDVYVQPLEESLAKLNRARFDLTQVREDEWEGREVWVVGDQSRQFWVDKQDLLFRRLLLTNPGTGARREVRMEAYETLGGGWIATELTFLRNEALDIHERYDYWTIDLEFEPGIFAIEDPARLRWVRN
jgi:hypothetical protein